MKKAFRSLIVSSVLLLLFIEMTYLLGTVDVKPIGPEGSSVGFSSVNASFFELTGVNGILYKITEIIGLIPLMTAAGFGLFGLYQLIKKRSLRGIDKGLLLLGGFYAAVAAIYLFFEKFIINYRPVILDEGLEASYPSTHTVLAVFIMSTAVMMMRRFIKNKKLLQTLSVLSVLVMMLIVIGRMVSGVHWLTDIFAGLLLSSSLSGLFYSAVKWLDNRYPAAAALNGGPSGNDTEVKFRTEERIRTARTGIEAPEAGDSAEPDEEPEIYDPDDIDLDDMEIIDYDEDPDGGDVTESGEDEDTDSDNTDDEADPDDDFEDYDADEDGDSEDYDLDEDDDSEDYDLDEDGDFEGSDADGEDESDESDADGDDDFEDYDFDADDDLADFDADDDFTDYDTDDGFLDYDPDEDAIEFGLDTDEDIIEYD